MKILSKCDVYHVSKLILMNAYMYIYSAVNRAREAHNVFANFMAILARGALEEIISNMLRYEVVFSPKEEGLLVDFASQHLIMSSIRLVNPASPVAWHLISSIDGRSPSGIRNRTMLDLASTEEKRLK